VTSICLFIESLEWATLGGMRNAMIYVISGALGAVLFDATLTPFISALMSELGVRPEAWAQPVAEIMRDTVSNEKLRLGFFGGLGAYFGLFLKKVFARGRQGAGE
jgi:hypothetical protein